MDRTAAGFKGRGSAENPANRFEKIDFEPSEEEISEGISPKTVFYKDGKLVRSFKEHQIVDELVKELKTFV